MIASILKKHLSGEEEEIGQAQFAVLLQMILEDLAEALAANPITTALDLNVNNGFQLQKVSHSKANAFSKIYVLFFPIVVFAY
jgi:hypothetical protein